MQRYAASEYLLLVLMCLNAQGHSKRQSPGRAGNSLRRARGPHVSWHTIVLGTAIENHPFLYADMSPVIRDFYVQ